MKKEKRKKKKIPLLARDVNNFNQTEREKKFEAPVSVIIACLYPHGRPSSLQSRKELSYSRGP